MVKFVGSNVDFHWSAEFSRRDWCFACSTC